MVGDNATTCLKLHQIVCEAHNNSIFRQQSVFVLHTQQFSDDISTHYCKITIILTFSLKVEEEGLTTQISSKLI